MAEETDWSQIQQLTMEIRNLAHRGWLDRPNAEFLFREIGKKAFQIAELAGAVPSEHAHIWKTISVQNGWFTECETCKIGAPLSLQAESAKGEGPSAGTPELALTIIRDALEVIRELKKLEEEWPAWYLTVEAEAEKFVTGADTPTGPHSSVIYTDLNVRCHACQRNVIWHYLEDVDTIQFLHSCDDAVDSVLPATAKEKE